MALSPEDKAYIAEVVAKKRPCECGLSNDAQKEMGHILGVIKDEGDGDYGRGAERFREAMRLSRAVDIDALKSVMRFFKRIDTASVWITRTILTFAVLWLLKIMGGWTGIGIVETIKRISP